LNEKQEKYKKNKLFGVWLPIDVHEWFVNYLKVKSIGLQLEKGSDNGFMHFKSRILQCQFTNQRLLLQDGFVSEAFQEKQQKKLRREDVKLAENTIQLTSRLADR